MPENTPKIKAAQHPRVIMDRPVWPWTITHPLTADEIAGERFVHTIEIEATRPERSPAWQRALAGALSGLWRAS